MQRFDHIIPGILSGILLPLAFMCLYLYNFYTNDTSFIESVSQLWGSALFGKLLLLSIMPDLILMFIFYKFDSFKLGAGVMLGMIPYLITSILMFN